MAKNGSASLAKDIHGKSRTLMTNEQNLHFRGLGIAIILLMTSISAWAQEPATRADALEQAREDRERVAEPYQPNFLERTMSYLEERPLFGRDGLYPKLGSLAVGSGFAFGAGYRTRQIFNRYGTLDVWAAGSRTGYFAMEARALFPALAGGRILAEGYARRDYPEERFFGAGPDSKRSNETDYLYLANAFGGRAGVRPFSHMLVGGGLDYIKPHIGEGTNNSVPTNGASSSDARW